MHGSKVGTHAPHEGEWHSSNAEQPEANPPPRHESIDLLEGGTYMQSLWGPHYSFLGDEKKRRTVKGGKRGYPEGWRDEGQDTPEVGKGRVRAGGRDDKVSFL